MSRLAVHPGIGATKSGSFGLDDANMIGGKGLAQCAGVKFLHTLVGHARGTPVALFVDGLGSGQKGVYSVKIGVDFHRNFVNDFAETIVYFGMKNVAQVPETKSLGKSLFADAHPYQLALAHVKDAHGFVQEGVDMSLNNRLEHRLHGAAGDLDQDRQRQ